jgi:hypothetical protein
MNRSAGQPAAAPRVATTGSGSSASNDKPRSPHWNESPTWLRVVWMVLLFSATILIVALATLMYFGGSKEGDYVDKTKQQAVFLASGQVYFSKVKTINDKYMVLNDIYYLNVNQQVQPDQKDSNKQAPSSVSLVKLGCELHGPIDQMIVNREQVTFWENLKDDGQVAQAVVKWKKQNPNGQQCQTATNNTTPTDANKP